MKLSHFSVLLLIFFFFFFACTAARKTERRSHRNRNRQQHADILSSTSTQPTSRAFEELTSEPVRPRSTMSKLVLIKPQTENANSGRFLHHLWLGQRNNIGQAPNGPVFVLNIPVNLNNTNNNTLTNNPPPAAAVAAVVGGGGGGGGVVRLADTSATGWPMPFQLPTNVYQQREGNQQQPGNVQIFGMLGANGNIIPVIMPNSVQRGQRKRNQNEQQNINLSRNPFAAFANNFRRVQYL